MPYDAPPDLRSMSLLDIARAVEGRKLPPIDSWNPAETSDSSMRIGADGHSVGPVAAPPAEEGAVDEALPVSGQLRHERIEALEGRRRALPTPREAFLVVAAVCAGLLANLMARGLRTDRSVLVILDEAYRDFVRASRAEFGG